jgi:hypothetical protein
MSADDPHMETSMYKRFLVVAALVVWVVSAANHLVPQAMASGASHLLEAGTYLSQDYVNVLKMSKSPYRADTEAKYTYKLVTVRYDQGKCYVTPETFHEGGLDYFLAPDNSLRPSDPSYPRPAHFKINSAKSFELGFGSEQSVRYESVGNVASYVAALALVGRYTDSAGRVYQFHSDGRAIFPDREFKYEIGLDHVLTPFDYFYEAGKINAVTPFQRDGDTIRLYSIKKQENPDFLEIDSTKPPVILRMSKVPK